MVEKSIVTVLLFAFLSCNLSAGKKVENKKYTQNIKSMNQIDRTFHCVQFTNKR